MASAKHATGRVAPGKREGAGAEARFKRSDSDGVVFAGARQSLAHSEVVFGLKLGRGIGEARDRFAGPQVDLRQLGKHFEADAIARELERPICWVDARTDPRRATDRNRVLAADGEQRSGDSFSHRAHPGEAGQTRASREVKDDGLGLIITRVAGRNGGGADLFCRAAKK